MTNKRISSFVRLFISGILLESSFAPAFSQTVSVVPVQGMGLSGAGASAAGAVQAPSSARFDAGLGKLGPAGTVIPLSAPLLAPNAIQPAAPAVAGVHSLPTLPALARPAAAAAAPAASALGSSVRRAALASHSLRSAAPKAGTGAAAEDTKSKLVPGIDLSDYAAEKLGKIPDAGARDAGEKLIDAITSARSIPTSGDVEAVSAQAAGAKAARPRLDPATRPYSPWRLTTFLQDPEKYAMLFLLGADDKAVGDVRGYQLLVGDAVHQGFESAYKSIQAGTPGKDIKLSDVVAVYEKAFDEGHKTGAYTLSGGWTAEEFKRRGTEFIKTRFGQLAPFESQGRVLGIEERVFWKMTDPATKKSYDFKGRIDRMMIKGDTIYIRDWKTHFSPPTLSQLEREDFQLGLYALGLKEARPDLVKGRKIVIVWDYKEFSQEIAVDDAYLARIEGQVFDVLRRIEAFTGRVEAGKALWLKRLNPDAKPAGAAKARAAVDQLGKVREKIDEKSAALRSLRREYKDAEEGLTRFATRKGVSQVKGSKNVLDITTTQDPKAVPTKTDDPKGYEAVSDVLKDGGAWKDFSTLDASAVRRAVEAYGGDDHAVFERLRDLIKSRFEDQVEIDDVDAVGGATGGVSKPKIEKEQIAPDSQPGVLSATQLDVFFRDPVEFAKTYILRIRRGVGPKPMGMLAGSSIHETMEQLFIWVKGGRLVKDISYEGLMRYFEERWQANKADNEFAADPGVTEEDYKSGSKEYIKAKWDALYPFDNGRPIFLEKRMFFTLTDPKTGRTYKFQGIPDRVMLEGNAVVIRDWKSHYKEPTEAEVKAKDYQLGLYILALRQLYPDLMQGRTARLVWDFKGKEVVINVDDAYLKDLQVRLFEVLRKLDAFKDQVAGDLEAWQEKYGQIAVPKSQKEAGAAVDRLGKLAGQIAALEDELEPLKEEAATLEGEVAQFSNETGWVRVRGSEYSSRLLKHGRVDVPTKGKDRKAYDQVVAILKEAGVWERYSNLDYTALKKALADPNNPDREVLKKVEPLLKAVTTVKAKLKENQKAAPSAKEPGKKGGAA